MTALYVEIEPYPAQFLRNLIAAGEIALGEVYEGDIQNVRPDQLHEFTQCHFFAGIGIWSYALRQAGWPDNRPVWTASCPCQPFSSAGKGEGFADERHLWPAMHHLIAECQPATVLGEQVASNDGLEWLDLVSADMEASGYAIGAVDTCAAGFGAPHIRQRLYFAAQRLADSGFVGQSRQGEVGRPGDTAQGEIGEINRNVDDGAFGQLALANCNGREKGRQGFPEARNDGAERNGELAARQSPAMPVNGYWRNADWLYCQDERWRPVEPGTSPLAHGVAGRVGQISAYGNGLCAPQAQGFIEAFMAYID